MIRPLNLLYILLILFSVVSGCSRTGVNPVTTHEIPVCETGNGSQSGLWGIWDVTFNLNELSAIVESNRVNCTHVNITSWIPAPEIAVNSYNPVTGIIDVDCTISNPYSFNGYDVRLIVFTDNAGHMLLNADDWTSLYDILPGMPINPFIAYAKSESERIFSAYTQHTENLQVLLPAGNVNVQIAIDASWPGNCEEPYEISRFTQGVLYDIMGDSTDVEIDVLSWENDVNSVNLYCPGITGTTLVSFFNIDTETWGMNLENSTGAPAGVHTGYVVATTSGSAGLALFDEVLVTITAESSHGWAQTWGGAGTEAGCEVIVDYFGNIYLTGEFEGSVDFDPGQNVDLHDSYGASDAFLCKFNANGDYEWTLTWGGTGTEKSYAVKIDDSGNLYVGGAFAATVDFDPGKDTVEFTSSGDYDIFISKFSPNKDFLWVRTWGGESRDLGIGLALHKPSGSLYSMGYYSSTVDFDPDPTEDDFHTSLGHDDIYLSKFTTDGEFEWAVTWGSEWIDEMAVGGDVDESGYIYLSGGFGDDTVDFDPGSGFDWHTSEGWNDCFLSKFAPNGDFVWARTWGGEKYDKAQGCVVDNNGDIYTTGMFELTVDFNPDDFETDNHTSVAWYDIFLTKFDSTGDHMWARTWGGYGTWDRGLRVEAGDAYSVYVTGYFNGPVDFDPGSGVDQYSPIGGHDMYLSRFDSSGNYFWARTWGGDGDDRGVDVTLFNEEGVYITGLFEEVVEFDPGPEDDYHTSNGGFDVFLTKINSDGYW